MSEKILEPFWGILTMLSNRFLNQIPFSCSSSRLLSRGPFRSNPCHQSTSTEIQWHLRSILVTSVPPVHPSNDTAPLTRQPNASPVLRGILLRTGTGGIRVSTVPQYVQHKLIYRHSYIRQDFIYLLEYIYRQRSILIFNAKCIYIFFQFRLNYCSEGVLSAYFPKAHLVILWLWN